MDIALVGPGRAGTSLARGLAGAGHRVISVAGRTPDAESTRVAAARFDARVVPVQFAGRSAAIVLVATPDDALEATAGAIAQSLEPDALVLHLSGARGLDALAPVVAMRNDVQIGALHPLQTLPTAESSLSGAWAAVAGPPLVADLARAAGMLPFTVADADRATYHAAAVVASNHVVALLGQVERLAAAAHVPFAAFEALTRAAVANAFADGPAVALTGPVARGDVATVARHLEAIPDDERRAYLAAAEAAHRLTGRNDAAMSEVLGVITLERIDDVRARCDQARGAERTVALVPTMGFFHEGHLTLMREARAANGLVVVSLFVNPTQFGPNEDLAAYPRDPAGDAESAAAAGVDVLFAPTVDEMYPRPALTTVSVAAITDGLCGISRPHHFGGVATVVTKLFSIVGPCTAYFGKKDFQQLVVVRRLVEDLNLPVEIVGVSTVRESDGLAKSSRNAYLRPGERTAATVLFRALGAARDALVAGERDAAAVRATALDVIDAEPHAALEYVEVVRADDLVPVDQLADGVEHVAAMAVRIGTTRLIDNATFTVDGDDVAFDLPISIKQGNR